jgi:hypothetical protein
VPDNGTQFRLAELERDIRELQRGVAPVPVHEQRLSAIEGAVKDLRGSVNMLALAVIGAAVTVAGSSAVLVLTLGHS